MDTSREAVINLLKQIDIDPAVFDAMGRQASELRPVLLEVAKGDAHDADDYMRKNAIAMLGVVGDDSSVGALIDLLSHERVEFRANAIRSLGNISSTSAADGLAARLGKSGLAPTEGKIIVAALAKVGTADSARAVKAFHKKFKKTKKGSPGLDRDLGEFDEVIRRLEARKG